MSKERQKRKQEEIREKILDAARKIIAEEGVQGLSIRKITNELDYSPAIIYHYFKGKSEIVETLMSEGYRRILAAVSAVKRNEDEPENEIREAFTNYVRAALAHPEEYKAFMLNEDAMVLKRTGVLPKGIANKNRAVKQLCDQIHRGVEQGRFLRCDPELTAQIIWTATFGLTIRLIIEKDISEEQVNRLIDHHFVVLFNGIMNRRVNVDE